MAASSTFSTSSAEFATDRGNAMNNIRGLEDIMRKMSDYERDQGRKIAQALTRAAYKTAEDVRNAMPGFLDRPTPWTLNSLRVVPASTSNLTAAVKFKDQKTGPSLPAAQYLLPQAYGGGRQLKPFEKALISGGRMPQGYYAVPGPGAQIDARGNVRRKQIQDVLAQLDSGSAAVKARGSAGRGMKVLGAGRKAGGRYFVVPVDATAPAGIYVRGTTGVRRISAVFLFVRRPDYQARFPFRNYASQRALFHIPRELAAAG